MGGRWPHVLAKNNHDNFTYNRNLLRSFRKDDRTFLSYRDPSYHSTGEYASPIPKSDIQGGGNPAINEDSCSRAPFCSRVSQIAAIARERDSGGEDLSRSDNANKHGALDKA